ncbi:DUF3347 domain-containing protein [Pedobacter cryoconitis]|uniref:DUF3347 domain-containing protein n=1 Tax=Pedobacter cryoconitis TaxID=188932 RepID=A0A7X0MI36_9SPHI|nr:DUF3347 domain-containing protein [Pedobacter cryoconitis]MBB6498048.1 hypothetical protein [Pedobacter cryoconitis]
MKRIFFIIAFIATVIVQPGFAQQNNNTPSNSLISYYYGIKDALVAGDSKLASVKAEDFIKVLNNTDPQLVDVTKKKLLTDDARQITANKELKSQRDHFADLSANMIMLVKTSKLSAEPIYELYCPMKKSNWLSNEKAVKNPYYGSAMLTCGKVTETIK